MSEKARTWLDLLAGAAKHFLLSVPTRTGSQVTQESLPVRESHAIVCYVLETEDCLNLVTAGAGCDDMTRLMRVREYASGPKGPSA